MKSSTPLLRKPFRLRRRTFLGLGLLVASLPAYTVGVEPDWIRIRHLTLPPHPRLAGRRLRWVHFTDVHHKGDRARLDRAMDLIRELTPDFVCFTGDLIEESAHLDDALDALKRLPCPVYGIPGNHDHWASADFSRCRRACSETGGAWLMDEVVDFPNVPLRLIGLDHQYSPPRPDPDRFNLVLMHYPIWARDLPYRADLLLAGHSHGGQVRIPGFGPLVVPEETGEYDLGWFNTPSGPLYVNPGLGTFYLDIRLNCRPELTVFETADSSANHKG